ncbi:hypothetical protein E4Z66_11490 [Aliishimia ponticola]|uniref:Uncharacterized protein n=1 Tax=Aliishimia ponticola TaxID=2499833 RepID=A0A4S4NAK4_9RHOB|nr:hypothetical protein [Aliishimia ponticola]THH35705.1 hypothetical protein E4Z66_11490 [Aliishimia ponticola]
MPVSCRDPRRIALVLTELLRRLGLSRAPVQPDVSAFTILNMLDQLHRQPDVLRPALGSVYEEVVEGQQPDPSVPGALLLDLRRAGQTYAQLSCHRILTDNAPSAQHDALIDQARAAPLAKGARPVYCRFTYWDGPDEVTAFLLQAEMWAESHVGPLAPAPRRLTAIGTGRAIALDRRTKGPQSEALLHLVLALSE